MDSSHSMLRRSSCRLLAFGLVAATLPASSWALPSDYAWAGGNHDNWSDANWGSSGKGTADLSGGENNFYFGAYNGNLLPLDANGFTNANLPTPASGDRTFGTLNFARQAWTMNGNYFDVLQSAINVSSSSPEVTIANNLIFRLRGIVSNYSTLDMTVDSQSTAFRPTQLTITGLIKEDDTIGIVSKYGAGTLILTNANTYSGGTNVFGGRLIDYYPHGNYNDNGDLQFHSLSNQSYNGTIFGAGAFTKSGAGAMTMSGGISYSGITTVEGGRLILGSLLSTRSFAINSGAELEFNFTGAQTLNKPLTGGGTLIKSGNGTFTLTAQDTHTGNTVVNAGKLFDPTPNGTYVTNGVLELSNADEVYLTGGRGISGSGSLIKSGAGRLWVSDGTYTGGTTVNGGRLTDFDPHGNYVTNAELEFRPVTNGTFSGMISGTGSLIKSSNATLTLAGVHTHSGGTTVEEGRLIDRAPRGTYVTNADLEFDMPQGLFGNSPAPISGTGSFTQSGSFLYVLSRPNTYAGATTVNGGVMLSTVDDGLPTSTALNVNAGATFQIGDRKSQIVASLSGAGSVMGDGTLTIGGGDFSGVYSGLGSLVKGGTGTLNLSGVNTYTGGTTVSGGRLVVQNPNGDYADNAALEFAVASDREFSTPVAVGPATPNAISGSGRFIKSGAGTLTMVAKSTYTGGTTVSGGRLIDPAPHGDYVTDAALEFRTAGNQSYAGVVSGTGSLTKSEGGTLTLSGSSTHTGGTFVGAGAVQLGQNNALPTTGKVDVSSGATLDLNGNLQSLGGLTGAGSVALRDSGRLLVNGDGSTFAGRITGGGAFTKFGSGTMTLSGTSDYTGGTRVLDTGTLRVTGEIRGGLNVAPDATFENAATGGLVLGAATLQGLVRTANSTRFTGGVTGAGNFTGPGAVRFDGGYAPGNSPASVNFAGDLILGASNVLTMELGGTTLGTGYDHLTVSGATSLGGSLNVATLGGFAPSLGQSFDLFDFRTATGTFSAVNLPSLGNGLGWDTSGLYTTGTIRTQAVPEPATMAALGLGALALLRRRRKNG